ncbi:MAG: hypothetical protein CVU84_09930 [Firmicutes bacterium HGW-Firmicutes-1]|jgi:GAF domain-containing protein|nr:MAG: hypothetical protein CVU84_09930 [Firmicutes bacterium HGW-Firmicutes-1]
MFQLSNEKFQEKEDMYKQLLMSAKGLMAGERDMIANLANLSSLIYHTMEEVNWAGFYLHKTNQLVLGPFHGRPACIRIDLGKGVCGNAAKNRETIVVYNVHKFEGHIACDGETLSEIVVPMIANEELIGVLDIDSIRIGKFDDVDKRFLEELVSIFITECF